jgi:hypothetical protein
MKHEKSTQHHPVHHHVHAVLPCRQLHVLKVSHMNILDLILTGTIMLASIMFMAFIFERNNEQGPILDKFRDDFLYCLRDLPLLTPDDQDRVIHLFRRRWEGYVSPAEIDRHVRQLIDASMENEGLN